jgi:hypothetical protein
MHESIHRVFRPLIQYRQPVCSICVRGLNKELSTQPQVSLAAGMRSSVLQAHTQHGGSGMSYCGGLVRRLAAAARPHAHQLHRLQHISSSASDYPTIM